MKHLLHIEMRGNIGTRDFRGFPAARNLLNRPSSARVTDRWLAARAMAMLLSYFTSIGACLCQGGIGTDTARPASRRFAIQSF